MDLIDVVSTILELSNKDSEYKEEIANLRFTILTLKDALHKMVEIELDEAYTQLMREHLNEARQLLDRVSKN